MKPQKTLGQVAFQAYYRRNLGQVLYEVFDDMFIWGPWKDATPRTKRSYEKAARVIEREVKRRMKKR
jgi:hypothetical protein